MAEESLGKTADSWKDQQVKHKKPKTKAMKHKRF